MGKKAFTLVEVIVVIAILSLLMLIFIPALAMAKKHGESIACLSNLQQMVITAMVYTNAHDGYFPMATVTEVSGSLRKICAWDFTTVYDGSKSYIEPGLLWEGQMMEKIQQCPSFRGAANWFEDPYTGYNYNTSYIGGRAAVLNGVMVKGTVVMSSKITEIRKPDRCALFGDGQYAEGANKFMRSPFPGKLDANFSGRYAGTQGYRHMDKTNVAWCDGSVRSSRDCFTETESPENVAEGTGFLSPDNSAYDLK